MKSFLFVKLGAILLLCSLSLLARHVGYDAAGRVIWSIQPSGQTTSFSYDANGNIESITSITPAEDTDSDGMPDYFEIRFSGTATALIPSEDTDQDGMSHLFEFAFGKDPSVPDAQNITPISLEVPDPQTGDQFFTLKYLRPLSATQHLSYSTQISFDLTQPWLTDPPAVLETVVVQQEGGVEEVTVKFLPTVGSNDKFFMRIQASTL
ncbi:RHS repeat domain-containing protein [Coraliomargarita sinensis]|nr:RHS repeat domain-containing protein [Coraliomargarita sinensis]